MSSPWKFSLRQSLLILLLVLFGLSSCQSKESVYPQISVYQSTQVSLVESTIDPTRQSKYIETFEAVWETVNERFFDPDFNGVDWEAVHNEYQPLITAAQDGATFYKLINEMCFELGVSHIGVFPADQAEQLDPVMSAPGILGIDIRLIDDQAVITSVKPGSPAAYAGLQTGYLLLEVDGNSLEDAEGLVQLWLPPYNERKHRGQITSAIQALLNGEVGETVSVAYQDAKGELHEENLVRVERDEHSIKPDNMPALYAGYKFNRLKNGIGYIRISGFLPQVLDPVLKAIDDMQSAPGIIIDIRGNPGGFYPVRKAIASQFFAEPTLLWRYITRPGLELPGFETEAYTVTPENPYLRPVVILVDALSGSSSEEFSGAMQAKQRAIIVGERTSGSDLVADILSMPNGAILMYPIAQTQTADGTILEGRGVIPDIEVSLDRDSLLQGIDTQLEAAIDYLVSAIETIE